MKHKRKIEISSTYEGLGELTKEEAQAIYDKRLEPKLGKLSTDEYQMVVSMRGGVIDRQGKPDKKGMKKVILWVLGKYPCTYYDVLSEVQKKGYSTADDVVYKMMKKLEKKGIIRVIPNFGDMAHFKLVEDKKNSDASTEN